MGGFVQAAYKIRPKEVNMIIDDVMSKINKRKLTQIQRNEILAVQLMFENLKSDPENLTEALSKMTPQERLLGVKLEELATALTPEQAQELLKLLEKQQADQPE
jgi:hypothetical protein